MQNTAIPINAELTDQPRISLVHKSTITPVAISGALPQMLSRKLELVINFVRSFGFGVIVARTPVPPTVSDRK